MYENLIGETNEAQHIYVDKCRKSAAVYFDTTDYWNHPIIKALEKLGGNNKFTGIM